MYKKKVPHTTVYRLAMYLREVEKLLKEGCKYVSSRELGESLGIDSAQVRKDLSYFGQFGKVGKGYQLEILGHKLKKILKLEERKKLALVGVGNLGSALLSYKGFQEAGFDFVVAFDCDPKKIGKKIAKVKVLSSEKIVSTLKKEEISIAIITVPANSAQEVADKLIEGGVRSIINFAPLRLNVPDTVLVRYVDLSIELMSVPFYIL